MQSQRPRSVDRPVSVPSLFSVAAGLLLMLAFFNLSGLPPVQAFVPEALSAQIAQTGHDVAKNNAVLAVSRQIEAIRRMPVSGGTRGLMRSAATHVALVVKSDENAAVSASKIANPVGKTGRMEGGEAGCLVRAPPQATV